MKYELTDEKKQLPNGTTLHRIRYLPTGDLGGWVESEKNLSGDAKVFENACEKATTHRRNDAG